MNLIKKIKFNYLTKLIADQINSQNFEKASEEIEKLKNNDPLVYYNVLKSLDIYFKDVSNVNLHKKKIIWTISFDVQDQKYINNFLKYYITYNYQKTLYSDNFAESLSRYLASFEGHGLPEEIKFNDIVESSSFFQNLLLFSKTEELFIFETCAAFFESKSNNYLIYPNTTLCYFYVVRDLKNLFIRYKKKLNTTEEAYNELFNYTKKLHLSDSLKKQQFKIYENKTNYNTNVDSWSDPNVLSAYKGKLISYKKLVNSTEEVLIDVIQHLKQYFPDIKVDYQVIQEYIKNNKLVSDKAQDISRSEEKFLSRNINLKNYKIEDRIDY